jgi:hypothetical protein
MLHFIFLGLGSMFTSDNLFSLVVARRSFNYRLSLPECLNNSTPAEAHEPCAYAKKIDRFFRGSVAKLVEKVRRRQDPAS